MEANTEAIIRLAWARSLAVPDFALAAPESRHVEAIWGLGPPASPVGPDGPGPEGHSPAELRLLSLFDSTAVVGPEWMLARVREDEGTELGLAHALRALGSDARMVAHDNLAYRDEYAHPAGDRAEDDEVPLISHATEDLAALIARCPIDDANAADFRGLDIAFTLLDDDHRPLAAAAYRIEHGLIADVRALTDPTARGRGLAAMLAELAVDDALDSGLIPQMRYHHASVAGARLASALHFTPSGSLIVLAAGPIG